jgi:hypothetical protein
MRDAALGLYIAKNGELLGREVHGQAHREKARRFASYCRWINDRDAEHRPI